MSTTFALIVGNRGFFPSELARTGREQIINLLEEEGYSVICPSPEDTPLGVVQTWEDAKKCAGLFKEKQDEIDGIIITLPNFGDEKAAVNTIRESGLMLPVLVHAFPDDPDSLDVDSRRDSFCGKLSVCNNLDQYSIPFTLTSSHTQNPASTEFKEDLHQFARVCQVVKGLRNIRLGAIGARPADFNTVRFSEKILESYGVSVETIDLSEVFGLMGKIQGDDPALKDKIDQIKSYVDTGGVPGEKVERIARFALVVENWIKENNIVATTIQCWSSIEENMGIMPCTVMSMMSEKLIPSACEVDVTGALSMYALQLASGSASALVDWNNNYGKDPDKAVLFHCGNFARSIFQQAKMSYGDIISTSVGKENAYGSLEGKIKSSPFTFARFTTDDIAGCLRAYVGEGEVTDDEVATFGARGVVHIPGMQNLLKFICRNGFEHHVAINLSRVGSIFCEAMSYLGIDTYWHS